MVSTTVATSPAESPISLGDSRSPKGTLFVIGGREDKTGSKDILKELARRTQERKMVIATLASAIPHEIWPEYKKIFAALGVENVEHFFIAQHEEAGLRANLDIFNDTEVVFFTGGDQLKITTKIGGTPIFSRILEIYQRGGMIIGTSAGAAIMGSTMLIGGEGSDSPKVGNWKMAPGLGFVKEMIIDQHFAQRGRLGRLLGAVAMNPGLLGVGIDEDTAIIIEGDHFEVVGTNAIYVIDGRSLSYTNISEGAADKTMSMHGASLHLLTQFETFNLNTRAAKPRDNP